MQTFPHSPLGPEELSTACTRPLTEGGTDSVQRSGTRFATLLGPWPSALLRGNVLVEEVTALRLSACPPGGFGQPGWASQPLPGSCVLESPSPTMSELRWGPWPLPQRSGGSGGTHGPLPSLTCPERQRPNLWFSRLLQPRETVSSSPACPLTVDGTSAIKVGRFYTHTHTLEIPTSGLT